MVLFFTFHFWFMLHGHIFLSSFSPFYGLWLPPNHIWNKIIISNDLPLWGFLVSGFSGSQACRAVIYHHSALSDLMYSHILQSKAIRWNGKIPGNENGRFSHWHCWSRKQLLRKMHGACLLRGAVFGIQVGCHCTAVFEHCIKYHIL